MKFTNPAIYRRVYDMPLYGVLTIKSVSNGGRFNTLVAAKSDDIQTNNATVASANILETNYQLVNNIWLSSIGIGKPDLLYNYDSVLYQIAHQCPFEGGWGVYWARGLYSYISHQDYNDDQLCGIGQERKHATSTVINQELKIIPNPAIDQIGLFWNTEHSTETRLIITNALQQPVYTSKTNASNIQVDVTSLPAGVYYAFVFQEGKSVMCKSFIIAK